MLRLRRTPAAAVADPASHDRSLLHRGGLSPAAVALVVLTLGCAPPPQVRYEERLEETPAPAVHAVHEQRLRELMQDLDRLRDERLPKVLDPRVETRRQARTVEQVAQAMAESAPAIAAAVPPDLEPADQQEFRRLAAELGSRSRALADEAASLTTAQRRERLAEIDRTCGRCHARFRIPGRPRGAP